ncbi:hypothetical protein LTR10_002170 [Elasticomyces elasticus]|nr:hypothetical protein LTR10_002170 [Elasticomyces elasticus]
MTSPALFPSNFELHQSIAERNNSTNGSLLLSNNVNPNFNIRGRIGRDPRPALPRLVSRHTAPESVTPAHTHDPRHYIKLQDFSKFWSAIKSSEHVKGASEETDIVKWTFKDGSSVEVKQEEHSSINHYITYSVITSQPELTYSSVLSTIRCYAVTSGEAEGSTFVEWTGNFSSDADAGVIQDAKFKRREALADLAKAAKKA